MNENYILKRLPIKVHGFTICIVDGDRVRRDHIEFTNFGEPLHFTFIPQDEIWLDHEAHPNEMRFFILDALREYYLLKKGYSYNFVVDAVDTTDHSYRMKARQDLHIDKKLLCTIRGTRIYVVNGDYVRTYLDPTFTEGGHGYVYDYIPKGEVWIDDDIFSNERGFIVLHELVEEYLMNVDKFTYDQAHQAASNIELAKRRSYEN